MPLGESGLTSRKGALKLSEKMSDYTLLLGEDVVSDLEDVHLFENENPPRITFRVPGKPIPEGQLYLRRNKDGRKVAIAVERISADEGGAFCVAQAIV